MPLFDLNNNINTEVASYELAYNVSACSGVYLYVDYEKGDESNITLTFSVTDNNNPNQAKHAIVNGSLDKYSITIAEDLRAVLPIPVPEPADKLYINVAFNGSGSSEGSLSIFINNDKLSW